MSANPEWLTAPALRTLNSPLQVKPGMVIRRTWWGAPMHSSYHPGGILSEGQRAAFRVNEIQGTRAIVGDKPWSLSGSGYTLELIEDAPDPVAELGQMAYAAMYPNITPLLPVPGSRWYRAGQAMYDAGARP